MPRRFGTDGIRGVANADLSVELVAQVARAVATACREGVFGSGTRPRPLVVVGRDTRPSGPMLDAAVVAGLCSAGADVLVAGVLPTPGVAFLTADLDADAGIVLSASHNPAPDNGVKVFGPGGFKLPGFVEDAIEGLIAKPGDLPTGADVGSSTVLPDAQTRYLDHLVRAAGADLSGIAVVIDCAEGAAFRVAPEAFRRAGAEVTALHADGDGARINLGCGATHPGTVAEAAAAAGSPGLTLDGDADRVLAADETGEVVDGDQILAILARDLREQGRLAGDAVAVTVMTNQAFRAWCASEGVGIVETAVGDRNVLEAMREQGLVLGGEQSGHVIRLDRTTTGDGTLTGLSLMSAVASSGGSLADLVPFRPLPQVLMNVPAPPAVLESAGDLEVAVAEAREVLAGAGRVLVRPSGTEPLIRVMVEATDEDTARDVAGGIARVIERLAARGAG